MGHCRTIRVGYFIRLLRHVRLLTHPIPFNPNRHLSEIFLAQLDPNSPLIPQAQWDMPGTSPQAEAEAAGLLKRYGVLDDPLLIAVNVNSSELSTLRRWPSQFYADLVTQLSRRYGATFLFIGNADDRQYVENVLSKVPAEVRLLNLAGLTTLGGLLALCKRVKLLISNDSGPLHLGALMGAPTISFFGPESGDNYGPRGDKHINLDKKLYCSPCLNVFNFKEFDCPYEVRCLAEIKPDEAFAAACRLLGPGTSPGGLTPHLARRASCPVCGSRCARSMTAQCRLPLLICGQCSFAWQDPPPAPHWLESLYQNGYHEKAWRIDDREEDVRRIKRATFAGWLERMERVLGRPGRLLDLGCASGFLLEAAQDRGWEAYGVEISTAAAALARERFGSAVKQGCLQDAEFPDGYFDAVTMFDFIEHLEDREKALTEVRRILRDQGILALSTPDLDSLSHLILGRGWPHFKSEHLCYFSARSLRRFLATMGFSVLQSGPAWKTLDLGYIASQFEQYPHPLLTPIIRRLCALLPEAWLRRPFRLTLGESFVISRKL